MTPACGGGTSPTTAPCSSPAGSRRGTALGSRERRADRTGVHQRGDPNTVDLSPDGRTLVAADKDRVNMWDAATGTILGRSWSPGSESQGEQPRSGVLARWPQALRRLGLRAKHGCGTWIRPHGRREPARIAGRSLTEAEWQALPPRASPTKPPAVIDGSPGAAAAAQASRRGSAAGPKHPRWRSGRTSRPAKEGSWLPR